MNDGGLIAIFLQNLPVLVVVIPLLLAPVVAIITEPRLAWAISVAGVGGAFLAAILLQSITEINWPGDLSPWQLGAAMGHRICGRFGHQPDAGDHDRAGVFATLYARASLMSEIKHADLGKCYAAWLLASGGLFGLVATGDAFNLFVFLEISALSSVILISMGAGADRRALSAGFNYLVIGAVGATFYVIGVGFVYAITGTLNIADLAARIADIGGGAALYAGFGFMIAGIMVKAAVFPVHIWLPAAYGYAPSAVSSLLAAIATKAALYVLARLLFTLFAGVPDITELAVTYVIVPLSLAGIFVGTVMAIYEKDIKLLLAHSSVAQIGYIALGFGLASSASVAASFVHIGNHALIKGGLFMAVGGFVAALGSRANLASFVGIGRRMPITATAFTVCGLSLAGLPLTAGFISKLYLVRAILAEDAYVITALVLLSSALSLIYLWKIIEVMWMQPAPAKAPNLAENPAIYVPLWIVALANIWFGVDASWLVAASRAVRRRFWEVAYDDAANSIACRDFGAIGGCLPDAIFGKSASLA